MITFFQILVASALLSAKGSGGKQLKDINYLLRTNSDIAVNCSLPSLNNDQWKWYHNKDQHSSANVKCVVEENEFCEKSYNGIIFQATKNFTELSITSANLTNAGSYTCMDSDARVEITHWFIIVDDIRIEISDYEVRDGMLNILKNGSLEGECQVTFSSNPRAPLPFVEMNNGSCESNITERSQGLIRVAFVCSNFTESFRLTCSAGVASFNDRLEEHVEVKIHHCPERVEFSGHNQQVVQSGGNLTCRVKANHKVVVEWHVPNSVSGYNEASFLVTKRGKYLCEVKNSSSPVLGHCPEFNDTFHVLNVTEILSSNQQKSGCPTCKAVKSSGHSSQPFLSSVCLSGFLVIIKKFHWLE